jgi:hypothetical protein
LESQLLRRLRQDDCLSPGAEDQPRYHSEMLERERERERERDRRKKCKYIFEKYFSFVTVNTSCLFMGYFIPRYFVKCVSTN